ncbi:UDP-glucosyltransferase 2-like [Schistocerca gregaria]|uniref:UDP-glucosyltransferase 2-like n=1 Tax=Schistocerca gregaria TaxID=7010 RepID=UPI00211EA12B|nr:UDP-glucosyltransferase 2-like [Schistocerca gregaria]
MGSPPVVKVLTMTAPSSVYYNFGNPMNPAYMPDMWLGYSDGMNFWQRLYNTYFYLRLMHMWFCQAMPVHEALMRKHFGPDPPSVYEADRNVSLLITTNHFVMEYPRPHLPNIIEITGIHVATEQKPLPKKAELYTTDCDQQMLTSQPPARLAQQLQQEEDRLLQPIADFWRRSTQDRPLLTTPQEVTDVIGKTKDIKLFLDGAEHGVIYFCLGTNLRSNAMSDWSRQEFIEAFRELPQKVLWQWENDSLPGRPENIMVSTAGRPSTGWTLERAVWWLEYVIRHKGAPHMLSAALDLHWWQRLLLDVIAFLLLVAAIAVYLSCISLRRLVQLLLTFKSEDKS